MSLHKKIFSQLYTTQKIFYRLNMKVIFLTVFYLALFHHSYALNFFYKKTISNTTGASCLDGSPYSFYYYQPDPVDVKVIPNKILIYFEETPFGWCIEQNLTSTLKKCQEFTTNGSSVYDFGSSNNYASSIMFISGILSPQNGGEFSAWPKVLVKSCDGGAYMGDRDPISYRGRKLHFRGSRNVKETLKYLESQGWLSNREEVVVAGSMNGAIAALMWAQNVSQMTSGSVRVIADSAIHLNQLNIKENRSSIQNRMQTFEKVVMDGSDFPNYDCQISNSNDRWKCMFTSTLINFISLPVFFTQSLYDGWSIHRVLGYPCAEDFGSLYECTQDEVKAITQYHEKVKTQLKQILKDGEGRRGAFAISCVAHDFTTWRWENPEYQVPAQSGNTALSTYEKWKKQTDLAYIDQVQWPENAPCKGIKPPKEDQQKLITQ